MPDVSLYQYGNRTIVYPIWIDYQSGPDKLYVGCGDFGNINSSTGAIYFSYSFAIFDVHDPFGSYQLPTTAHYFYPRIACPPAVSGSCDKEWTIVVEIADGTSTYDIVGYTLNYTALYYNVYTY